MTPQAFALRPFPGTNSPNDIQITGSIARQANILTLRYCLLGDLSKIALAAPAEFPTRKHELWQETCFEFFLGAKESDRYWEFNLSPAEDWNVYRFDGYRQGMQEETAWTELPFRVEVQPDTLWLTLDLNLLNLELEAIAPVNPLFDVAITTVVKPKIGEVTYWALAHTGSEANFHRRDSFLLQV